MAEERSKTILHREFTESIKKHTEDNKAHRKHRHSEGGGYSLKRGKWQAGTLVNALRVAKIRSNLHTGQYASSVPSDHGQRQALVESLSLPGVTWNVNKFLCETAQEGGQWTYKRYKLSGGSQPELYVQTGQLRFDETQLRDSKTQIMREVCRDVHCSDRAHTSANQWKWSWKTNQLYLTVRGWPFLWDDCGIAMRKHFLTWGSYVLPHNHMLISRFRRSTNNMKKKRISTTKEWMTSKCLSSISLSSWQVEEGHWNASRSTKD